MYHQIFFVKLFYEYHKFNIYYAQKKVIKKSMLCMTFQIAIVGHNKFYEQTVVDVSEDDLKKYVKFVCVNEKIPKNIPDSYPKECIINEWDIPEYESYYQENNFYQNSFFFNLMNVIDTLGLEHIGFGQYDMIYTQDIMDQMKEKCQDIKAAIGFYPYPIEPLFEILQPGVWQFIIQKYSNFFDIAIDDIDKLDTMKLALFHTFIIPVENYKRMMCFTKDILKNVTAFLGNNTRHMAGTLERVFALFLNLEIITGNMQEFQWIDGLVHDDVNLRLADSLRGLSGPRLE